MCHSQMSQLFLVGSFRLTLGADISKELYLGGGWGQNTSDAYKENSWIFYIHYSLARAITYSATMIQKYQL